jgi:hypothetical protein
MTSSFGRSRRRLSRLLGSKKQLSLSSAALIALVAGVGVFGYWTTGGSGSASAGSGTLTAATISAPSSSGASVTITWTAQAAMTPASQNANITYTVERKLGSGSFAAIGSGGCSGSKPYGTSTCVDSASPSGTYAYRVVADFSDAWTATSNEVSVDVDASAPNVSSIVGVGSSPTNAATVAWMVTFDEVVTGVNAADFTLVGAGASGAAITLVSGVDDIYTVTASTGADGNLGLNLVDNDSIEDGVGNDLGGAGAGNGNFTGEVFVIDKVGPTNVLSLISQTPAGSSYFNEAGIVFYRGTGGGSGGDFRLRNALTDAGTGPASGTTSALGGTTAGWSHTPSTASTPAGGPYDSNAFQWTEGTASQPTVDVTGADGLGNTTTVTLTLKNDSAEPVGGALTVNGQAANGAGTTSGNFSGTFPINVRTNYTETPDATQSGLASSTLVRESAPLASNACGTFGSPTTISGSPTQNAGAGIASGNCYRYTLTGTDNVGNAVSITTTVKVDTSPPAFGSPALTFSDTGNFAHYPGTGTNVYYNGTTGTGSSITVNAPNVADPQSEIQTVNFPTFGSDFTGGGDDTASPYSATYTWSSSSDTGPKVVTAVNNVANSSISAFTLVRDVTAPGGGALTVNSVAANGAGTTSNNTTGSFTIGTRTDYSEALNSTQSGLATSTLVRESAPLSGNACGSFGSATTITGSPNQNAGNGITGGNCYRYTLTGTDNVSNSVSISTIVKVDTSAPNFGSPALTLSDTGAFAHYPGTGTTVYYNGTTGTGSSITVDAPNVADPETGVQSITFPSIGGFSGDGADSSSPYSATYTWSSSNDPGTKNVTAANTFGSTSTASFNLVRDVTAPAGGALTVNSGIASGAGSTSYSTTGTFTGTRTDYAETQSATAAGLESSTLVRTQASLAVDGTCGAFATPTTIVGVPSETALADGCYRYTLTGTDNVGNAVSILTTVYVDKVAPTATNVQLTGNNGTVASGDSVVITYSELMDASSFCSGWANGSNQTEADNGVVTVTITNSGTNDLLTVSVTGAAGCVGGFKLGTIALNADYVTTTRTFSGNGSNASELRWNVTARTLTVELGNPSGAVNSGVAASVPSYTADTAIKDRSGNSIGAGPYLGTSSRF